MGVPLGSPVYSNNEGFTRPIRSKKMDRVDMHSHLKTVQEEMIQWQDKNFPGRPEFIPAMGFVEEYGELVEHSSKPEPDVQEIIDAIGDMGIYLCDFANSQHYDLETLRKTATEQFFDWQEPVTGMAIEIGHLYHSFIKTFQKIRMHESHDANARAAVGRLLVYLDAEASNWGTTFDFALSHTWAKVKQRDWQKNRNTAHQV